MKIEVWEIRPVDEGLFGIRRRRRDGCCPTVALVGVNLPGITGLRLPVIWVLSSATCSGAGAGVESMEIKAQMWEVGVGEPGGSRRRL